MNRIKQVVDFVKEHPWEIGCVALAGVAAIATANSKHLVKVANFQSDELDRANRHFERIAEALVNGWEIVLSEDAPNLIDIVVPDALEVAK